MISEMQWTIKTMPYIINWKCPETRTKETYNCGAIYFAHLVYDFCRGHKASIIQALLPDTISEALIIDEHNF